MAENIYLTSVTCEGKCQNISVSHVDTEKHYNPGPKSRVYFDNGGEFTVSTDVFRGVKIGKTYKVWLEEIGPELVDGVSAGLIVQ